MNTMHRDRAFLPTRLRRWALFALLLPAAIPASALDSMYLDLRVMTYTEAHAPEIVDDIVFFTFRSENPARHVAVRFAHEGFGTLRSYSRNENGVFVLDYALPEGITVLRYRIVVDGLWMRDPMNPAFEVDRMGEAFSVVEVGIRDRMEANPRLQKDGSALFTYRGAAGKAVALVGDFNNWDPFMDRFDEKEPGFYELALRLRTGSHGYYFFVDGDRVLDPRNHQVMETPDGLAVSVFSWPPALATSPAILTKARTPSGGGGAH